jgi:hypothetical protein
VARADHPRGSESPRRPDLPLTSFRFPGTNRSSTKRPADDLPLRRVGTCVAVISVSDIGIAASHNRPRAGTPWALAGTPAWVAKGDTTQERCRRSELLFGHPSVCEGAVITGPQWVLRVTAIGPKGVTTHALAPVRPDTNAGPTPWTTSVSHLATSTTLPGECSALVRSGGAGSPAVRASRGSRRAARDARAVSEAGLRARRSRLSAAARAGAVAEERRGDAPPPAQERHSEPTSTDQVELA